MKGLVTVALVLWLAIPAWGAEPCPPPRTANAFSLASLLTEIVLDAEEHTAIHRGLVYLFSLESRRGGHIFGELRRNHPRLLFYVSHFITVHKALSYKTEGDFTAAMRAGLPDTVGVRMTGRRLQFGCQGFSDIKGRVEGAW